MRILFRNTGEQKPAMEIKRVDFVEFSKNINFTSETLDGIQKIVFTAKNEPSWQGVVYDFIQLVDN
jgi:hypothetical protein